MRARRATATLLCGTFLLAGACGNDESGSTSSTATAPGTTAGSTPRGFTVDTPEGQLSLSLDGDLPPGWPSSFPLPPGATPAGSGSLGASDTTAMVGVFSIPGQPQAAYDYYTQNGPLPVESSSSMGTGSGFIGSIRVGGRDPARVTVVPSDDERTLVIVTLTT